MRDLMLDYLRANKVTGFTVTDELPWSSSGQPLYQNNPKRIYVDRPQTSQDPLIEVFNNVGIVNETTTLRIYLSTDAKTLPANYDTVVEMIKSARLNVNVEQVTQRVTTVSTEFVADTMVTQFDISFTKLIVNT